MTPFYATFDLNFLRQYGAVLLLIVLFSQLGLGALLMQREAAACVDVIGGPSGILDYVTGIFEWISTNATDLYNSAANWATAAYNAWEKSQSILKEALKFAWERFRKMMLNMLVNDIIKWIQGGGKPRFMTDFQGMIKTAADKAGGQLLEQVFPLVCDHMQLSLRAILAAPPYFDEQVSCTVSGAISNVKDFFSDFSKGGWTGWASITEMQNNFYGSYLILKDESVASQAAASKKIEIDLLSSSGFVSPKVCARIYTILSDDSVSYTDYTGSSRLKEANIPANAKCVKWETQTPGQMLADTTSQALGIDIPWLINAKEFSEFAGAIIDAVINRAFKEGLDAMASTSDSTSDDPANAGKAGVTVAITKKSQLGVDTSAYTRAIDVETYLPGIEEQLKLAQETLARAETEITKNKDLYEEIIGLWEEVSDLNQSITAKGCDPYEQGPGDYLEQSEIDNEINSAEITLAQYEMKIEDITDEEEMEIEYGYGNRTETMTVQKGQKYLLEPTLDALEEYTDLVSDFTGSYSTDDENTTSAGRTLTEDEITMEIAKDKAVKLTQLLTDSDNEEFEDLLSDVKNYTQDLTEFLTELTEERGGVKSCAQIEEIGEGDEGTLYKRKCSAQGFIDALDAYLATCEPAT